MADKKISELTEKSAPDNDDLLALVDSEADPIETKKIKASNITKIHSDLKTGVHGIGSGKYFAETSVEDLDLASHKSRHAVGGDDTLFPADPGADKFLKWNDSSGALEWANAGGTFGIFGDGSDGDVTISSNTSLTRDMFYNNLTVNSGVKLTTAGWRIFVKGTLTNNGTIDNSGGNGGNGGNGTNSGGTGGVAGAATSTGYLGASIAGKTGGIGGTSGGNAGTAGDNATSPIGVNGAAGGAGGNSGYTGGAGGAAGAITITATLNGVRHSQILLGRVFATGAYPSGFVTAAGSGSGGGGSGSTGSGGGGGGGSGGGGGFMIIAAYTLTNNGTISANGGNGGNGGNGNASGNTGGGGGGAGGSGGIIALIYSVLTQGTISANGGTGGMGGTHYGTGTDGGAGNNGNNGTILYLS